MPRHYFDVAVSAADGFVGPVVVLDHHNDVAAVDVHDPAVAAAMLK